MKPGGCVLLPASSNGACAQHHQHRRFDDMVAGFGAGFVAVTVGFPLDLIKTRMQTSHHRTAAETTNCILTTARSIVRKEGVLGMYKGLASPLMTLSVSSSINFTAYNTFRGIYKAEQGWHVGNYLAGLSSGPISAIMGTVENLVRTQMQIDNVTKKRFRNAWHCLSSIIRYHGLRTLYTGWSITTMRDTTYLSTYFFVYEGVKGTLMAQRELQQWFGSSAAASVAAIPIAGGAAGTISWFVAYPIDCVRAGLQGQALSGRNLTARKVFFNLLQSQGIRGFFAGVAPTLVRAPFVHSIRFSAYESLLWLFRKMRSGDDF